MQLNNKQFTQDDLSILIHKSGFSFCTLEQHYFLPLETSPPTVESLKSFVDYHQLTQSNVRLIFMEHPGVCVPHPLFDESKKGDYFKGAIDLPDAITLEHYSLEKLDIALVFPCDDKWISLFKNVFPKLEVTHYSAVLLPALSAFSFGKAKKNLFLHLRKDTFDLMLFQGGQLLVQNSFPHKNADDFLYYLFYVTEQFFLQPDQFNLFFLGRYLDFSEYYQGVQEFHPQIDYFDPQYPSIDPKHPAPFFQSFLPL